MRSACASRCCASTPRIRPATSGRRPSCVARALARGRATSPSCSRAQPSRTNLVVRHRGTGKLPPLLLTAHLDVVEADPTKWRRPPFSGDEFEGCLWGRGAIDMKNMAAMCTAIMRRLARDGHEARPRHHLRGGRRRGGRLRSRLAVPRRAAPRARSRPSTRSASRAGSRSTSATRRSIRCRSPRRASAGCARGSPASPATARCRAHDSVVTRLGEALAAARRGAAAGAPDAVRDASSSTRCARASRR